MTKRTSKKVSPISEKQRNKRGDSPNSLKNLVPFKRGQSGNPGGTRKGTPKISTALAKLLAMSLEDFDKFKPVNVAEELALELVNQAQSGKPAVTLAAIKEITDRTEGRAPMRVIVDGTDELERLVIRVRERVLTQTGVEITREMAVERITAYKPELAEVFEESFAG
jgi:hypothetical protein